MIHLNVFRIQMLCHVITWSIHCHFVSLGFWVPFWVKYWYNLLALVSYYR